MKIRKFTRSSLQSGINITYIVTGGLSGYKRAEGRAGEEGAIQTLNN